jgi:hypothetical protein
LALDNKIAELQRDAEKLQGLIQRLATVTADLDALRKARAVMASEMTHSVNAEDHPASHTNGNGNSVLRLSQGILDDQNQPKTNLSSLRQPLQGSIGFLAIEVLRQAGKPLHVGELFPLVKAQGKPQLTENTLVSTLCNYVNSGRLKRISPSVYGLP